MKTKSPFWKRPSKGSSGRPPQPREREAIQDDYNRACNEAGDIQYKLVSMSKRLDWLTQFRGALNEELAALEQQAAERRVSDEAEIATAPPPPLDERN